MTPEELNRTIEFITASTARLAAAQEQDRHDRLEFQKRSEALDHKLSQLLDRQTQLLDIQSQRMDRMDKVYEDSLEKADSFQRQALHLLNLILDRLPLSPFREA